MKNGNQQLLLFSGGRDSTLVAAMLMNNQIPLHLITADNGCGLFKEPLYIRYNELKNKYSDLLITHHIMSIAGSFREIALLNIENDILKFQKNLVLLGEKLAMMAHAIVYCIRNEIKIINDGLTKYQDRFSEQREIAKTYLQNLCTEYNVIYKSPIYESSIHVDDVKNKLLRFGLSPKSMEGVTIFGSTASNASDEVILQYLKEKESITKEIITFLLSK